VADDEKGVSKMKSTLPFARAYNFLLKDKKLTSAEKLVMIVICRYWPSPYWGTNQHTAEDLGFSERYIEKVIKNLAGKGYIKRGYAHTTKNDRPHTVRVIVPKCFPGKSKAKIKWMKPPEHVDGQHTEHMDGDCPNNGSFLPEHTDDLLDRNRKINRKAMPAPLPAKGQASTLQDNPETPKPKMTVEQHKQKLQKQIEALRVSEQTERKNVAKIGSYNP
jgi:hypothetical protein